MTTSPLLSSRMMGLLAASCALAVANLYFNQPLLTQIGHTFATTAAGAAPVSTATQLGYATGLFLVAPLGDRLPRKGLIVALAAMLAASLAAAALAQSLPALFAASFAIGITATLAQQIVPMAAHLAPEHHRGRVVGTVMSGLLFGILGGRVVAGFVGEALGWRIVFGVSAAVIALLGVILQAALPTVAAASKEPYGKLLRSVFDLARRHTVLRAAALNGALLFGAFSLFWVGLTPLLAGPAFRLDARAAGLFGLVGIAGALIAPLAGRMTDTYGSGRILTFSIATVIAAFAIFAVSGSSLWGLAVGTLLLDMGIQGALIANQARIFALQTEARSRINAFFMTAYFAGGATGSALAGALWTHFGWSGVALAGVIMALIAALVHFASAQTAGRTARSAPAAGSRE